MRLKWFCRHVVVAPSIPIRFQQIIDKHHDSLCSGSKALHPNVTDVDSDIVIVFVSCPIGKVLHVGILCSSDACKVLNLKEKIKHLNQKISITGSMLLAKYGFQFLAQAILGEVTETLEVIAHCGLNRKVLQV